MSARYRLDLYTPAGAMIYRGDDFLELAVDVEVNGPGMAVCKLASDHRAVAQLERGSQVEVWRSDPEYDIAWYRQFNGAVLADRWKWPEGGDAHYLFWAPGDLQKLDARIVNWYAGYADRSQFLAVPGETIMKTLVNYNAGAAATVANGRKRAGVISGLAVQADGAAGTAVDWYCHGENLLQSLQKLAPLVGGDFDLVKLSATSWEFRWYTGQLGTDRSAGVLFAIERGNVVDVELFTDYMQGKTAACVWGQAQGSERAYSTVLSTDFWSAAYDVEMYVDAKDIDIANSLTGRGQKDLAENAPANGMTFKVSQTPACMFGKHYFLGDLAKLRNPRTGVDDTVQVYGASLNIAEGGDETVDITLKVR